MRKMFLFYIVLLVFFCAGIATAGEQCVVCHEGIESISKDPDIHDLDCTKCHRGDAKATTLEAAHKGMYANPSDLRVVDKTCGKCHKNEVAKVKKSLHSTSAGKISGTRYAWGTQGKTDAIYANYDVDNR